MVSHGLVSSIRDRYRPDSQGRATRCCWGGPESEPFAKQDSAITETRNFTVFMVPDEEYPNATITDFPALFAELNQMFGEVKRVGMVGGGRMPAECYSQIEEGFKGTELVDITDDFVALRFNKSPWELEQIRAAFGLADLSYEAMKAKIAPGVSEIEVAAAGEYAARGKGATGFGFTAIVGSGPRAKAVVPTATSRVMEDGELVMIGLAPKVNGYAGVMGDLLPVSRRIHRRSAGMCQSPQGSFPDDEGYAQAWRDRQRDRHARPGPITRSMA